MSWQSGRLFSLRRMRCSKKSWFPWTARELAAKILPQVGDLAKLAQGQVILMSVGSTKIGPADQVASESLNCGRDSD